MSTWDEHDEMLCTPCCQTWLRAGEYGGVLKRNEACPKCKKKRPNYIYRFRHRATTINEERNYVETQQMQTPPDLVLEGLTSTSPTTNLNSSKGSRKPNDATPDTSSSIYSTNDKDATKFGAPDPTAAEVFVQSAFDRFIEALTVFEDHIGMGARKGYVQQLLDASQCKSMPCQNVTIRLISYSINQRRCQ